MGKALISLFAGTILGAGLSVGGYLMLGDAFQLGNGAQSEESSFDNRLVSISNADTADAMVTFGEAALSQTDVERLLMAVPQAARMGLKDDPKLLHSLLEQHILRDAALLRALADEQWLERDLVIDRARGAARETIMRNYVSALARDELKENAAVVRDIYEKNKEKLFTPTQHRFVQIYIAVPDGGDADQSAVLQTKVKKVYDEASASDADFIQLATEYSDNVSDGEKVVPQWAAENELIPELRALLPNLKVGDVSAPFRSASGWHIVKYLDQKDPQPATFEQARAALERVLLEQYVAKKGGELLESVRDGNEFSADLKSIDWNMLEKN